MKKLSIILAGFLMTGVALAHVPVVTLDPIGSLEYASFPQTYNVTGTVTHTDPSNVDAVKDLTLWIDGIVEGAVIASPFDGDSSPSALFSLPWNITSSGTYIVKVTAKHGGSTGEDLEDVVVSETEVYVGECPAAPAVAVHYLQSLGVKSGSKTFKNIVSLVAKNMGPTTDFNSMSACDEGYEGAVQAFVDANMSVAK
jgi:hypothetical protein